MFEDKPQSNNQSDTNSADLNGDKPFPFKKVDDQQTTPLEEKKLTGMKGPVEDILAETEDDQQPSLPKDEPVKEIEEKPVIEKEPGLKETPSVPSMERPVTPLATPPTQPIKPRKVPTSPDHEARPEPAPMGVSTPPVMPQAPTEPAKNKTFMILIIVFIIIIFGLAGVFAYQYFTKSSKTESDLEPSGNLEELLDILDENANTVPTGTNNANVQNQEIEEDEDLKYYTDTDSDGLTDKQEFDLGTNINKFDTDDDGLSDFEEVEIYNSDPINPDTDNDTYLDGDEVEHGYDPLRPGNARL